MITQARFIESTQHEPYTNLALENYLLETVARDMCILYLWQNQRTVVIGRNQNAWQECRVSELTADGGHLARRLSGGGAVFHDLGNLNFTFLLPEKDFDLDRQLAVILQALHCVGLKAEKSGRNDLTIDGRKFSGNAFYHTKERAYHHGTLLVNVNGEDLSRYLQVDPQKLQSNGVASVKSRVVNLGELQAMLTISQLKKALVEAFGDVYGVAPQALETQNFNQKRLTQLTEQYASWDWCYGAKIAFTHRFKQRFAWGSVECLWQVKSGRIAQAAVYSDAMDGETFAALSAVLTGVRYNREDIAQAVLSLQTKTNAAILQELAAFIQSQI